ncbi:hypothetical protein D3C76_1189640 [compost metagenome]
MLVVQLHRYPPEKPKTLTFIVISRINGMIVNRFWITISRSISPRNRYLLSSETFRPASGSPDKRPDTRSVCHTTSRRAAIRAKETSLIHNFNLHPPPVIIYIYPNAGKNGPVPASKIVAPPELLCYFI